MPRDFAIFHKPLADDPATDLDIVDPYAAADERSRKQLVNFAKMLVVGDAPILQQVRLVTYDADSVNLDVPETSEQQFRDLQMLWHSQFEGGPQLVHQQRSRRQSRDLHDREVRARTRSGRTLIWDLGRGVSGVMATRFGCRVTLTED